MTPISESLIEFYNLCADDLGGILPEMTIDHHDNLDGTTTWTFTPIATERTPQILPTEEEWEMEWAETLDTLRGILPYVAMEAIQEHLGDRIPKSMSCVSTMGGYAELTIDDVLVWKYKGPFMWDRMDHHEDIRDGDTIFEIVNTFLNHS